MYSVRRGQEWFFGYLCQFSLHTPLMKATALDQGVYAAFQRRTLCVSYHTYNPSSTQKREAGIRDGLTNEFVDMLTYQVLIQTLQLSKRKKLEIYNLLRRSEDSVMLARCWVKSNKSLWHAPKQTTTSLCHWKMHVLLLKTRFRTSRLAPVFRPLHTFQLFPYTQTY